MNEVTVHEFLAMGGYAAYVWPAYGATLLVLAVIWIDGRRRRRMVERALAALDRSERDDTRS